MTKKEKEKKHIADATLTFYSEKFLHLHIIIIMYCSMKSKNALEFYAPESHKLASYKRLMKSIT